MGVYYVCFHFQKQSYTNERLSALFNTLIVSNYEPNSVDGIKESPNAEVYPHPVHGVVGSHAREYI